MTDTCKRGVSNFVWKLFESLLSLYKQRYFGEVSLSLICIISVLPFTRSKIVQFKEDLAVIAALNHSGYFGRNFHKTEFPLTISIQYQLERYKMMGFKGLNILKKVHVASFGKNFEHRAYLPKFKLKDSKCGLCYLIEMECLKHIIYLQNYIPKLANSPT